MKDKGDLEEALRYTTRALGIGEMALGPDHEQVAGYTGNIGLILRAKGDLEGALQFVERALRIEEKAYGPDHPETKIAEHNLLLLQANIALDKPHTPPPE